MRRLPSRYMPHRNLVAYRPYLGESAYGPLYGDEVICARGAISDKRRFVRGSDGEQVISESRIALDLPDHSAINEKAEVTIWRGTPRERTSTAIVISTADWPRLPMFLEIALA